MDEIMIYIDPDRPDMKPLIENGDCFLSMDKAALEYQEDEKNYIYAS